MYINQIKNICFRMSGLHLDANGHLSSDSGVLEFAEDGSTVVLTVAADETEVSYSIIEIVCMILKVKVANYLCIC